MSPKQKFRAVIEDAGGGGAYVSIPFDVEQIFGNKRPKVKATIQGVPYRGTLVRMGGACHLLQALAFFIRLSYTHQKEYVRWIEEARRAQTRQSRVAQTVELLLQEKKER
jgi:hypothetical protein